MIPALFRVRTRYSPVTRSRTMTFGDPPRSVIRKRSLSSRLREEQVKYRSCVFQPFSSPGHPLTRIRSRTLCSILCLLFLPPARFFTARPASLQPGPVSIFTPVRHPFPASSYKRPAYFTTCRSFFPFSVLPGHFIMTDGSQRLMPGTKVISSSEIIMQR